MAMVLGYFLSSALTNRMQRLEQAAVHIQSGDFDVSVPVQGNDELAALAAAFNQMAVQLKETAEKQEQLDALRRDLVAWAGHDLQTPLASVQAIIEALADGVIEEPELAQRYLRSAQRDVQNLSLLIDDLFQMAQFDAGGLQLNKDTASLGDLISDTLESFSHLSVQRGVELSGQVTPGIDPVYMDVQRIGRVLNNLISNAIHHTPSGGKIAVEAVPLQGSVRVQVHNSGDEIPPEDLPNIFERFYRGEKSRSRSTGGAGLGLAIAKSIVEAHGGEIGVENRPGDGVTFYFTLPVSEPT
jgi:signal transduction histidine kinase